MSDNYLSDPRANTFEGWIAALQIFSKYTPKGLQNRVDCHAEHDVLFISDKPEPVGLDEEGEPTFAHEHQEDAAALDRLGFHWDSEGECWSKFT